MTTPDTPAEPALRFKRRKIAHAKRAPLNQVTASLERSAPEDATANETANGDAPLFAPIEDEDATPNLREVLRNRIRPRDRIHKAARKPEPAHTHALVVADVPKQDLYGSRFVAQTGQVVDKDDKQM
jgi:hypothetical protein